MRALQPPFLALTEKIVRGGSASINSERNSAKFMILVGISFILMGSAYVFDHRRTHFGIAYVLLGLANIGVSVRRLQLAKKRTNNSSDSALA